LGLIPERAEAQRMMRGVTKESKTNEINESIKRVLQILLGLISTNLDSIFRQ
jgi:hypothetical protein